jgi:hypothetical protein
MKMFHVEHMHQNLALLSIHPEDYSWRAKPNWEKQDRPSQHPY